MLEREKTELSRSVEQTKADLVQSIEREKAELAKFHEAHKSELQDLSAQRQDALNRKRDIYTQIAATLRIFLKATVDADQMKRNEVAFLEAYDKGYIWASESVILGIRDLIVALENKAKIDAVLKAASGEQAVRLAAASQQLNEEVKTHYQRCMLEMRKDGGCPESKAEYRVVVFG